MKDKRGFTIAEILIVSGVLVMTITATIYMYVILQRFWKGGGAQAGLQSKTRITLDHMSRNMREATQAQVVLSGNGILLTLDPNRTYINDTDDITCEYMLQDNQLIYIQDTSDTSTQQVLLKNVLLPTGETLFQLNDRTIAINLKAVDPNQLDGYQASRLGILVVMRNE